MSTFDIEDWWIPGATELSATPLNATECVAYLPEWNQSSHKSEQLESMGFFNNNYKHVSPLQILAALSAAPISNPVFPHQ